MDEIKCALRHLSQDVSVITCARCMRKNTCEVWGATGITNIQVAMCVAVAAATVNVPITCSNGSLLARGSSVLVGCVRILFCSATFSATQGVDPDRGALWLNTVDQGVFDPKSEKWPRAERNQSVAPVEGEWGPPKQGRWRQPSPSKMNSEVFKAMCVSVRSSVGSFW